MTPVSEDYIFDRKQWEGELAAKAGVFVSLSVFHLCDEF